MNQPLVLAILAEICIVLLTGMIVLLIVNRREKKRRQSGIEELLDNIKDRQEMRGNRLALTLVNQYRMSEDVAATLSEKLLAAEKHFLYGFVEQQMQQQPIGGFYDNLCQLLDRYLENLTKPTARADTPEPEPNAETKITTGETPANEATLTPDDNPPPDWGDVFD